MKQKKYLVILDGYRSYGAELYFVGLFNSEDDANKAIDDCLEYAKPKKLLVKRGDYKITEIDEGRCHYPEGDYFKNVCTDIYLGGYVE